VDELAHGHGGLRDEVLDGTCGDAKDVILGVEAAGN